MQPGADTSPMLEVAQEAPRPPPARFQVILGPAAAGGYHDRARAEVVPTRFRCSLTDNNVEQEHDRYNWSEHREKQPIPRIEPHPVSWTSDEFDDNARQTEAEIEIIRHDPDSGSNLSSFLVKIFLSPVARIGRVVHKYVRPGFQPKYDIVIPYAEPNQFIGTDSFGAPDTIAILEYALGRSVDTDCISYQQIRTDYVPDKVEDALKEVCHTSNFVNSYGNAEYGHIDVSTCDNILRMYEALVKVYNTLTIFESLAAAGWEDVATAKSRYNTPRHQTMPKYFGLLSYEDYYPTSPLPKVVWVLEDMYCGNMKTIYHKHIDSVRDLLNKLNDNEFERVNLRPETFRSLESVLWDRDTAVRQIYLAKKYRVHRTGREQKKQHQSKTES
jgi:hypothetical protein